MAGGDKELSSRPIPEEQNEEESDDYQLLFKHFKEHKVEIASAITKPFPFLMSLRDKDFISEQKFQEYQEICSNLLPVENVVYSILSNIQKKFSRDLLKVIFSKTHLKAYPDLNETLKHFFLNVSDSPRTHQRINGRNVVERPRLPSVVREEISKEASKTCGRKRPSTAGRTTQASKTNDEIAEEMQCNGGEGSSSCEQTCDEQEPQDDLPSSLRQEAARRTKSPNWSNSKRRLQKKKPRQDEMMEISKETSKTSGRKRPSTARRTTQASKTNDEQAEEMQCSGGEGCSSCEETCDEQEPQDDLPSSLRQEAARRKKSPNWSNSKRRQQKKKPRQDEMMGVISAGVASPGHGVQEKLKAVSRRTLWKDDSSTNVKEVTKTLRARMRCAQTSNSQEISKEASKTCGRKRPSTA